MNQNELREYLFQKDLEHDKEMDKLLRDAQPKKIKDDYKLKLIKPPIITRDLIGPDYIAEKVLMDLSLDQQMQNMIKQANYAVDGKTPEPMKGSVTEEMIADYKKEVMKPVEIGGKFHLYRPVEIPPIPSPKLKNLMGEYLTEESVNNERDKLIEYMNENERRYYALWNKKSELENKYSYGGTYDESSRRQELLKLSNAKLNEILQTLVKNPGVPKNKRSIIDRIINAESKESPNKVLQEIKNIEIELAFMIENTKKLEAKFISLAHDYELQQEIEEENKLKIIDYENKKRQLAQDALSEFNRMNRGKTEVVRQQNESDDDFLKRLKDMGNIFVDPEDMNKQIETEILLKAKKNIMELTTDYDKAESVLRMLNNNERFQMNKMFPQLKKKYSDTFGLNNKNMDDVEMSQFIRNEIQIGQSLITPKTLEPGPEPAEAETVATPAEATPAEEVKPLPETKITVLGLKLYTKMKSDNYPELNLRILRTKSELIRQLVNNDLWDERDIYAYLEYLKDQPQAAQIAETQIAEPIFNLPAVPLTKPTLAPNDPIFNLPAVPSTKPKQTAEEIDFNDYLRQLMIGADKGSMSGVGLKSQVMPQKFIFGKIAIDLNKLFYQNVLSIKKHNGHKIIGHRNKKVSDNFVDVIFKMIDEKPITQSDLKNISNERLIYDNLIVQSGLHKSKKIPTTIEQTSQEMKDRLGLLVGEIEAGNSNKKLLEELHELLFKMVRVNLISKSAATTYYTNLKKEFFTL